MSLELLLVGAFTTAGTMGLLADGDGVPEPCWGTLGETGSILTMAGAEPRQTDWDKTTTGPGSVRVQAKDKEAINKRGRLPGWLCSMECSPCRMRVLAAAWVWLTGREATHTGLGWMGGLVLRIVLAFNVAELGRTSGGKDMARFVSVSAPLKMTSKVLNDTISVTR